MARDQTQPGSFSREKEEPGYEVAHAFDLSGQNQFFSVSQDGENGTKHNSKTEQ